MFKEYQLRPETVLFEHQKQALAWAEGVESGILAAEMGTGKTVMALCIASAGARSLIVTPTSLLEQWRREAVTRFTLKTSDIVTFHGPDRHKRSASNPSARIVLTTTHTLWRNIESLSAIQFNFLIVDEAHEVRNSGTLAHQALLKIKAEHRFLLTGTPAINGSHDVVSLFRLLKLQNSTASANLSNYFYRIDKNKVLNLPKKTEKVLMFEMTPVQAQHYQEVIENEYPNSLVRILRSRQASLLNFEHDGEQHICQKFRVVRSLVTRIPTDDSMLVFCSFTASLQQLHDYLTSVVKSRQVFLLTGKMSTDQRTAEIARFNAVDGGVFLISLKAGGTGLNLVKANHVVMLDPYWNVAIENQAIDRAHRIGQTKPVTVSRLIAKGTIEEWVTGLQETKQAEIVQFTDELNDSVFDQ
jgi:SNF2 family DNA or RNA helicase